VSWSIREKVVLVTGGNSGIGRATAEELARRGARVTITARDPRKGRLAADEIQRASGAAVEVGDLDLSRLDSVREFAATFSDSHGRLDVLINNAGVITGRRQKTVDGNEWTFGVNHLGPFLLTNLLTDLLVASSPSRIINVSSRVHQSRKNGLDFEDLHMKRGYSSSKAYAASKLANILFTLELDRRLRDSGVSARALHPGVVATSFGQGAEGPGWIRHLMPLIKPVIRTPQNGAATSVHLACADPSTLLDGLYWSDCKPKEPSPAAVDPAAASRLWAMSEELVGLVP